MFRQLIQIFLWFSLTGLSVQVSGTEVISLSKGEVANYVIVSSGNASECEKFAALELKRYLSEMSNANFKIVEKNQVKSIVVTTAASLPKSIKIPILTKESYAVFVKNETIYLTGENPRATLFAVYDFLEQLGCQWVAPDFDYFDGANRSIPAKADLNFKSRGDRLETPSLKYRKLYVEEGRTHTLQNLKQLIDWMPKTRFNTLVIPTNYQGHGKVKWDNWRDELTPELQKRGIIIEVGGHGYQNLINASMEGGKLFENHPEWFGADNSGARSNNPRTVICTSNSDAVNYLYKNLLTYLKSHPEIAISDFWPPDGETWCQCEACQVMGTETERHIILVNQVAGLLQKELPNVIVECLAYSRYTAPPAKISLDKKVLLDFCPINQCFESQIYESGAERNKAYNDDLTKWRKAFDGDISIYSYFRKYAWKSLPNIIPHYMQNELKYYKSIGTEGISVYSEPGDWFTYGVNHFVLSELSWNPNVKVDSLIRIYAQQVYGRSAHTAIFVYNELEDIVRFACNLPYTTLKKPEQYNLYETRIKTCRDMVVSAIKENQDILVVNNLRKLELMLEYADQSIAVMRSKSSGNKESTKQMEADIKSFVKEHASEGIFIP